MANEITDADLAVLEAAKECERRYSLHVPWPVAEELRLALIKDCQHTRRFEFAGGEWQCERCGFQSHSSAHDASAAEHMLSLRPELHAGPHDDDPDLSSR